MKTKTFKSAIALALLICGAGSNASELNLLKPEDTNKFNYSSLAADFKYRLVSDISGMKIITEYQLIESTENYAVFQEYSDGIDGTLKATDTKVKWENGLKYIFAKGYKDFSLVDESCKFVVGVCEYQVGKKVKKVKTSFKNGVWERRYARGRTVNVMV